ncbi:MAG TPA: ABC transporter permease [Candidatus Acidoferrales bacterium]|nr:ABC transporter permease [Candidatus Acidoferrales bacterium]
MLKQIRSFFRVLKSRDDFERGMSEELRFHVDQYMADLIRAGVPPPEAARRARIEFGSLNSTQEECREARGLQPFDELRRQLRHAGRTLRKTPRFTATALLTLAVCLGANLTIFAVVNSILLRPLPFPAPDRLVTVFNTYPKAGVLRDGSSTTNYYERRGQIPAFSDLAIYSEGAAIVGETGATERVPLMRVSPEFFSTLGANPVMGRSFTDAEMAIPPSRVVILSDSYWRRSFNADPRVLGRQVQVAGVANTVVGVLPPGFRFLSSEARLYFPFASRPEDRVSRERHSGGNSKHIIARLKPGATLAQAQAQIDAQNNTLERDDPKAKMLSDAGFRSVVVPLRADHVASIRPTLLWMQGGALALLLIGAVNLANLLLIRASGRIKELAVRQALGASRWHVVSEVAVETTLLTLAGGFLGLAGGWAGIRLLGTLGAERLPLGTDIAFDARLAMVAVVGSVILGIALALPIAWFNLSAHLAGAIQSETRGGTSGRMSQRLRHGFIVAQIAMALVLLEGAGLLGLSLKQAMAVSPGFRPDHVLTGQILLPPNQYPDWPARLAFNERLLAEISRQPGVTAVGAVNNVPLSGNNGKSAATVKGYVRPPGETLRGHYSYGVDGNYFAAMGFSLLEGRFLSADDSQRGDRVCVVDEDFARFYWPHASALGQRLFEGSDETKDVDAFTVVGVVGAVKQAGLTDDAAQGAIYYPYALRTDASLFVVLRTSLPPESVGPALQTIVRQTGRDATMTDVRSMETRISDSLITRRAPALLATLFSAIALLLTAIGTYGILSYAVAQRRREIGVRMALGARPQQIRGQFLALGLRLLAAGTMLGVAGAWVTGRAMRNLLFHVPPFHVATLAGTACIIGLVSLVACLVPAHQAACISPTEALADE